MSVGKCCERKIAIIAKDSSLQDDVLIMRNCHMGEVVEGLDNIAPIGVVSVRGLEIDVEQISACNIANIDLITVPENYSLSDALDIMQQHRVRRLPVVDSNGSLSGLFGMERILKVLCQDLNNMLGLIYTERNIEKTLRS